MIGAFPDWRIAPLIKVIDGISKRFAIEPTLIRAIIQVESAGEPWATRFEDGFRYLTANYQEHASRLRITFLTEYTHQKTSWGLMQIMGATARDMGYKGHLPKLCAPDFGIYWGTFYLKRQLKRYEKSQTQVTDAIAAYNAGSARMDNHGKYRNQSYVDKVIKAQKLFVATKSPE
jgi:soluble lytic murein transglycosylase-like protein